MERSEFVQNFSKRLLNLMQNKGYGSVRSKAGVEVTKLADITGCSYQMARRYVLGEALPELHILPKIATWLDVSPSWLLFGEKDIIAPDRKSLTLIEIETEVLTYILTKCIHLFSPSTKDENVVSYIVDMVYDASHLNTDKETIFKIIDMMTNSATKLNQASKERKKG